MPHGLQGERVLMRIFIGERDRSEDPTHPHAHLPLYEALLHTFRERGFAGATVTRAIAGFGAGARIHTGKLLELSLDLPVIVEVVETEQRIEEILPELDRMLGGGLITLEPVRVIRYRPAARRAAGPERRPGPEGKA